MSYKIELSGHGADPDDVQGVFEDVVRALRTIGGTVEGSLSAADDTVAGGPGINLAAADVADVTDTADPAEDDGTVTQPGD